MDAAASEDEWCRSGRRNRVVLASRRWGQACHDDWQATVAKKPGHRGDHV